MTAVDAAALAAATMGAARQRPDGLHVVDLRAGDPRLALAACAAFVLEGDAVLHGSRHDILTGRLTPRPANDAAKASGNHRAVYATAVPSVALWYAVLDRARMADTSGGFRFGYAVTDGAVRPWSESPPVFGDGWVYVVDRCRFQPADEVSVELWSADPVTARCALRVPAACGPLVGRVQRTGALPA